MFSGYVYDASGTALSEQTVELSGNGTDAKITTGYDGSYSLQVNTGTYNLDISHGEIQRKIYREIMI